MVWSGEFQEMEQAERRLMLIIPLAVIMVIVLLYLAFHSLIDVALVLSSVVVLFCGGIWALLLTRDQFQHLGRGGLHLDFRRVGDEQPAVGLRLPPAAARRPADGRGHLPGGCPAAAADDMIALAAILGLLPAALSTRIGAQSQRPLAIVVIGGMLTDLLLNRYFTPVLYSVFRRKPPSPESARLAE